MNRARRIAEYEQLGMTLEEAQREADYDRLHARLDRRAWRRLRRTQTRVAMFLRHDWVNLLWSLFIALLAGLAFRDIAVWAFVTAAVVAFHWRLWQGRMELDDAKRALKRSYMANRVLQGAVESSAEYIVEQRMAMEGNPIGPVVWIDGRAFPVDDEQFADTNTVHEDDDPTLWVGDEKQEG